MTHHEIDQLKSDLAQIECWHPVEQLALVKVPTANGKFQLRRQCGRCLDLIGTAVGFEHAKGQDVPLIDQAAHDKAAAARKQARSEAYAKARSAATEATRAWLSDEYLASEHWRVLRLKVLERAAFRCEGCQAARAVEVHHTAYRPYGEFVWELRAVCRECFNRWHELNQ